MVLTVPAVSKEKGHNQSLNERSPFDVFLVSKILYVKI